MLQSSCNLDLAPMRGAKLPSTTCGVGEGGGGMVSVSEVLKPAQRLLTCHPAKSDGMGGGDYHQTAMIAPVR